MMKQLLFFAYATFFMQHVAAQITQVIVPMAGLGTRLLPLTKSMPKSMVPLVDRPALHHIVDEALASHISDFCFIINEEDQETIENYFSPNVQLDAILHARNKGYLLEQLNEVLATSTFAYIIQPEPIGLGHAVLMGKPYIVPGAFFCVMLPDNIIETDEPHMARLIALAQEYDASIITVEEITQAQASQYAVITPGTFLSDDLVEVVDIVEKPISTATTMCLGQMGRHVFSYDIFEALEEIKPGVNGEYQLTDAVRHMIKKGKRVLAYKIHGQRYDIGNTRGLLRATVSLGLHNPMYKEMVQDIFHKSLSKK
jgi:UTP--glucose-1-phosphate uridylyltransferase